MHDITERVFTTLTPQQSEAASAVGAVLTLSGAGTGKTSTLTAGVVHRLVERGMAPARLLVVTFTNKAANEMGKRIRRMLEGTRYDAPVWMGTFHSLGYRQLRECPEMAGLAPRFSVATEDDARDLLTRVMRDLGLDTKQCKPADLAGFISALKDCLVTPEMVEDGFCIDPMGEAYQLPFAPSYANEDMPAIAAQVYPLYQALLRDSNCADFGDLLLWPTVAMRDDVVYRQLWSSRFDGVMADEYQDVNLAQYTWLRLLAAAGDIFVVGDDAQAIFSWRGADVRYIRAFTNDFPDATTVLLEQNFRSTGHILDAANAVIAGDAKTIRKRLFTTAGIGKQLAWREFASQGEEAREIASHISRLHQAGAALNDIAVVYRSNTLSSGVESALLEHGIRSTVVNGASFFKRKEVMLSMALLRLMEFRYSRQSDIDFNRIVLNMVSGVGDKARLTIELLARANGTSMFEAAHEAQLPPRARTSVNAFLERFEAAVVEAELATSLDDALRALVMGSGLWELLSEDDDAGRLNNVNELFVQAADSVSLDAFLEKVALGAASEPPEEAVTLTTMHGAKGLEWETVYLPGWDDAIFPNSRNDEDEERRLAYVALTRARRQLFISSSLQRFGGAPSKPNLYLNDIPDSTIRRTYAEAVRRPGGYGGQGYGGGGYGQRRPGGDYAQRLGQRRAG